MLCLYSLPPGTSSHSPGICGHRSQPSNILIRNGPPLTGVIGDIDDVMFMENCNPQGPDILSTPAYGAPFKHCDRMVPLRRPPAN